MKIRLANAAPGDEHVIAALLAELGEFYGGQPEGTPEQRAAQVRGVLFADAPAAHALLAWDGETLAGFASWSLLWLATGLTTSLYLKELYVAESHRRNGIATALMDGLYRIAAGHGCSPPTPTTPARRRSTRPAGRSRKPARSFTGPAGTWVNASGSQVSTRDVKQASATRVNVGDGQAKAGHGSAVAGLPHAKGECPSTHPAHIAAGRAATR